MKKITLILTLISLVVLTGCPPKVNKNIRKLEGNVTVPVYTPFNLPQSSIGFPSIFVGTERSIENVCFSGSKSTEELNAPDSLKIIVNRDTNVKAALQADFENELVKAGLSTELAKSTSSKISIEVDGIKIVKLTDISGVTPDFNNASCNTNALNFYVNDRTIITGALKAEKYVVKTESGLSSSLKSKIDAAMDTLNLKLNLAFEKAVNASGDFEYSASNVFFGGLTTKLAVVQCEVKVPKVEIKKGVLFEIDENNLCSDLKARLKRSSISSDFTVEIFPKNNARLGSGQIDVSEGKVTDILVNDVTLASLTIDQIPNTENFKINLNIFIVGIKADQVLN